jgi:hypothetical protein
MEEVGIFYVHLVRFAIYYLCMAIWYIFGLFGIFFPFWYLVARKIWQPFLGTTLEASLID